jgi:ubiquinol-cytochrome c reductase cytochrome c subunit
MFLSMAIAAAAILLALPVASVHAQEAPPKAAAAPAGNADRGKKLYNADGCYQCHGYVGQGGTGTGPRIAPNPLPYAALSAYIRAPKGQMPPYTAKLLKDADLADIYAYLKSIPEPPKVKDIPLLSGN